MLQQIQQQQQLDHPNKSMDNQCGGTVNGWMDGQFIIITITRKVG